MPRTKSLAHYPKQYQQMIQDCALHGAKLEVRRPTVKEALSLRGHWYAFLGSLKAEANRLRAAERKLTAGEQEVMDMHALSATVMVNVAAGSDGSATVTWQSREHSWQAQAVAGATRTDPTKPPAVLDDIATQLLRTQKEVDRG